MENETAENRDNSTQQNKPQDVPLPDPSLLGLVTGLANQAMLSMGIFPNPIDGSRNILPNQARHLIETIALLDEKTKGNKTEEETKVIANVLHELRMIFVAAQNEKNRRDAGGNEAEDNQNGDNKAVSPEETPSG